MPANTIKLDPQKIQAMLDAATTQTEAVEGVYRMVFPAWDWIAKLDGWPTCNKSTATQIMGKFMAWDEKHFPIGPHGLREVMPGGAWMNNGFSTSGGEGLKDWQVRLCGYTTLDEATIDAAQAAEQVTA
jgi:hypothetical protein